MPGEDSNYAIKYMILCYFLFLNFMDANQNTNAIGPYVSIPVRSAATGGRAGTQPVHLMFCLREAQAPLC